MDTVTGIVTAFNFIGFEQNDYVEKYTHLWQLFAMQD